MTQPLLILGGGLMGLAMAHGLACRGRMVTVLSRRRNEAAGFVAAGMLAPHAEGLSGPLLELGQRSLERIPAWVQSIEADSGLGCGLRICGIVVPFATAAERDAYPTAAWGEPLDRSGLERQIAGMGPSWQAGLLFPQDGQIDNRRRLMRALERACVNRGVRFEEGCEVLELVTAPDRGGVRTPHPIRNVGHGPGHCPPTPIPQEPSRPWQTTSASAMSRRASNTPRMACKPPSPTPSRSSAAPTSRCG
jgi:glycine oxidase